VRIAAGISGWRAEVMLSFTGSLRVFLRLEPCDMRKGFEGLNALVSEQLKEDVRSGALFVFTNKRHTVSGTRGAAEERLTRSRRMP
jgi:transposase